MNTRVAVPSQMILPSYAERARRSHRNRPGSVGANRLPAAGSASSLSPSSCQPHVSLEPAAASNQWLPALSGVFGRTLAAEQQLQLCSLHSRQHFDPSPPLIPVLPHRPLTRPTIRGHFYRGQKGTLSPRRNRNLSPKRGRALITARPRFGVVAMLRRSQKAVGMYGASSRIANVPGTSGRSGSGSSLVGGGAGPMSAVTTKTWWVFGSIAMVRAPSCVLTFATTLNLSGESSWIMVRRPFSHEANARCVSGSKRLASVSWPILGVAISLPVSASTMPSHCCRCSR